MTVPSGLRKAFIPVAALTCIFSVYGLGFGVLSSPRQAFKQAIKNEMPEKPSISEPGTDHRYYIAGYEKTTIGFDVDDRSRFARGFMVPVELIAWAASGGSKDNPLEIQGEIGVLSVPQFVSFPVDLLADDQELTAKQARDRVDQAYGEFMKLKDVERFLKENPEGYFESASSIIEPIK
jgi:hypothetical protein